MQSLDYYSQLDNKPTRHQIGSHHLFGDVCFGTHRILASVWHVQQALISPSLAYMPTYMPTRRRSAGSPRLSPRLTLQLST